MALATNTTPGTVYLNGDIHTSNDPLSPELTATGVLAGTYEFPHIVVDGKGRTIYLEEATTADVPCATGSSCGITQPSPDFEIDIDGVVDLPLATASSLGVVQPDGSFTINNGLLSISQNIATTSTVGIIQVGANLGINTQGILSRGNGDATTLTKGLVQIGNNIDVAAGVLNIPDATNTVNGVVNSADINNINIVNGLIDVGTNISLKSINQTYSATQNSLMQTINSAAGNITIDASIHSVFKITATDDVTIDNITNMSPNEQIDIIIDLGDLISEYSLTLNPTFFKISGNTISGQITLITCIQINDGTEQAYTIIQPYMV